MKIALINTLYHPNVLGGAERAVQTIAEGLADRGHTPVVIATHEEPTPPTAQVNGVRVHYLSLRNLYWPFDDREHRIATKAAWHAIDLNNPVMARAVGSILEEEGADVVNTHTIAGYSTAIWREVRKQGLPLIHTLHDYYLLCPRSTMFRSGQSCETQCRSCALYSWPRLRSTKHVSAVTGVSRFVLDLHKELDYFPGASAFEVIPNPISNIPEGGPEPATSEGPLRLGYIGRLHPTKGLEVLASAVRDLQPDGWQLSVAGHGEPAYERELKNLFSDKPVRFLGHVDASTFFESIDVLVIPSLWRENSPMVIYEAFAHGTPVIGARRGGIPELIAHDRTGVLFEPTRPIELTEAIERLMRHRTAIPTMGAECLKEASKFSVERVVERYVQLYERFVRS